MTAGRQTGVVLVRPFAVAGGLIFVASLLYGAWSYAWTFGVVTRDGSGVLWPAVTDILLFTAFALHHSVFARTGMKRWVATVVPAALERSVYVWVASTLFIAVCALWRPVGGVVWSVAMPWAFVLLALQLAGVGVTARASATLDVLALAGLRQVIDTPLASPVLVGTGLYRLVRHPIYFGWVLLVWPIPTMTGARLVFAAVTTLYLAIAIPFEERSLRREFGSDYDRYAAKVRWRMVPGVY